MAVLGGLAVSYERGTPAQLHLEVSIERMTNRSIYRGTSLIRNNHPP